jgi:hypothetical protein
LKRFILRCASAAIAATTFCLAYPTQAQEVTGPSKDADDRANSGAIEHGMMPPDRIVAALQQQGYSNIAGLEALPSRGSFRATATDPNGSVVVLLVNGITGLVQSSIIK